MRTRLLLLFAFAAATVLMNVASAGNIAHGVEVVVIDAGHGGKFPGAHYGGVYEKDLTLKVALKLGKLVEEGMPGVKVVYTRTADRTLGADLAADLQARADIANKAGGDLFISIHANAAPRATGVRGVETLIMGESSKEQRYNENALFENNREDLIDMSDERTAAIVRAYIQNLQFTYGEYSEAMARLLEKNYKQAGRYVRKTKPQLLKVLYFRARRVPHAPVSARAARREAPARASNARHRSSASCTGSSSASSHGTPVHEPSTSVWLMRR